MLAIGDTHTTAQLDVADVDHTYALANVQLFRRCITSVDILATLMALGPDASNFVPCAMGNTLPNFGYLNAQRVSSSVRISDAARCQQILRENLAVFFSACDPITAIGFDGSAAPGRRIACWANGRVGVAAASVTRPIRSLQTAIVLCGGISTLCYLFARVVEQCPTAEHLQAATLAFVLRTIHTNSALYTEFTRVDGMRLLSPVIRSTRCRRGDPLLGAILDIACDQAVLTSRRTAGTSAATSSATQTAASDDERTPLAGAAHVNVTTTACVVHAGLLVTVIRRYADWHTAQRPNGSVIETLLGVIQALVREKHPRQAINQRRFADAGLVPALLHFCKFHLVGGIESAVPLSVAAAQTMVGLVSTFAGAPPAATLLDEIVKVLLLLHQPSDSFITHDRSKFYYLVTPAVLQRQRNRLSLPHLATMRRRSPAAAAAGPKSARKPGTSVRQIGRSSGSPARALQNNTVSAPDMSPSDRDANRADHSNGIGHLDLSDIADCSRSPGNPGKWSLHEADAVAVAHQQQQRQPRAQRPLSSIGTRRRLVRRHTTQRKRTHSTRSGCGAVATTASSAMGTDSDETTTPNEVSESGFDEKMSGLVNQYDIIAADDILEAQREQMEQIKQSHRTKSSPLTNGRRQTVTAATTTTRAHQQHEQQQQRTAAGVRAIQVGLFGLLKDFILILPDSIIRDVLAHYVTVDVVLVLANHRDAAVRAAIVRLLAVMCQRLGDTALGQMQRSAHSWLHVGNQMALHPVDEPLVLACCQWATGSCLSLDQMIVQPDLRIVDRVALHAVLAVLPQTAGDLMVLRPLVQLIERLYGGGVATAEQRQYLVENGLVAALAKCVQQFFQRWGSGQREFVEAVLVRIAQTVSVMAIRGLGSINVLWDLLNVLTFFEDTRNAAVLCGVRAFQSDILNHLVLAFLPPQRLARGMSSFKFSGRVMFRSFLRKSVC